MLSPETSALVINAVSVGICTFSLLVSVLKIRRSKKKNTLSRNILSNGYTDDDGTATPEAIAAFSDLLPRATIVIGALGAFGASIARIIVTAVVEHNVPPIEAMLASFGWLVVLVQTFLLNRQNAPVLRWDLGLLTALQAIVLVLGLASSVYAGVSSVQIYADVPGAIMGLLTAFASLSLPRRPAVTRDGRPVDAQFNVSAIER